MAVWKLENSRIDKENTKLKRMYAELAWELDMAKYAIEKSSKALCQTKTCGIVERAISKGH